MVSINPMADTMPTTFYFTKDGQTVTLQEMYDKIKAKYPNKRDYYITIRILQYAATTGTLKDLMNQTAEEENTELSTFIEELISEGYDFGSSYSFR